ncbi:hypothetical protein ZYGR_0P00960 [Zygosaccharomyces rouxii]|uniref:Chromatin modification-related protein EAF3 n=1 Tax=Zygosaccharomyces rouxii TaxID=4956 RepID=A0A1Q3A1E2_ZYGRO|nr:hypothetical protein ZYGR_0P00960 [Zygosaccharomyces rouxii]
MLEVGGKCLAYHGPMLYEAKVLRIWNPTTQSVSVVQDGQEVSVSMKKDKEELSEDTKALGGVPESLAGQDCYFVHYQGWKSTWDEWIGLDRIREYNDENLGLKKRLIEEAKEARKQQQEQKKRKENVLKRGRPSEAGTVPRTSSSGRSSSNPGENGNITTSGNNGTSSTKQGSHGPTTAGTVPLPQGSAPKITLHIPVKLKSLLVDDWEYVTKDKKVCKIPSPVLTVQQLLEEYEASASNELESPAQQSQLSEYCMGLRLYFERSLPLLLLYRLERLQYEELLQKEKYANTSVLHLYGPIHLLRLLSILPDLMATTTMDGQSCQLIVRRTEHLFEWIVTNTERLFNGKEETYVNTSSQYEGVALGL